MVNPITLPCFPFFPKSGYLVPMHWSSIEHEFIVEKTASTSLCWEVLHNSYSAQTLQLTLWLILVHLNFCPLLVLTTATTGTGMDVYPLLSTSGTIWENHLFGCNAKVSIHELEIKVQSLVPSTSTICSGFWMWFVDPCWNTDSCVPHRLVLLLHLSDIDCQESEPVHWCSDWKMLCRKDDVC